MSKIKEELFTDKMGRNIYIFPPALEGNNTPTFWRQRRDRREGVYTGIPLKNLEGTYKRTFGKKVSFGNI